MSSSRPTEPGIRFGFKEWASVCEALGRGRQILILRRGGIHENGGEFIPSHQDFLLLPTYWHQQTSSIKPADRTFLAISQNHYPQHDILSVEYHAVVTDSFRIQSLAALERVRSHHIWSDEVITERYHRWKTDQIYGLLVRVFRLDHPLAIPIGPEYAGCRSWISLPEPAVILGETPVLSDPAFDHLRSDLRQRLTDAEHWRPRADWLDATPPTADP